jgi:hypothetical protein
MPDRFGNPTPYEVLANITAERDAMMSQPGLDPTERRLVNLNAVGRMLVQGMDPRLLHAQKIESVMQRAMSAQRDPNESQLDYEIRTGRAAMSEMINVDPSTAAAISEHLTKLEDMRIERRRTLAEDARAEDEHKWSAERFEQEQYENRIKDITDGVLYEVDKATGKATGHAVNTRDENYLEQVREIVDGRGNLLLNSDQVAGLIDTTQADVKLWNNSTFAAKMNTVTGAHETAITANKLMEAFIEASSAGVNTQTYYSKLERGFEQLIESRDEFFRALNDGQGLPPVGSDEFNEDRSNAAEWLQGRQLPVGVTESTLVRLAYTWAKSFDNRVTEADFQKAYDMLAGNSGNPAVVANTIRAATFERYQQLEETVKAEADDLLRLSPQGSDSWIQGESLNGAFGRYKSAVDVFGGNAETLIKTWGGTPSGQPRATQTGNVREIGGRQFRTRPGGQ